MSMACCGLRRRVRTITCAAGAVATIIRLEVRAGAPGAAVPVVAGGSEAGLGAGVAGGRREPRPQQQNLYDREAGKRVGHGVLHTMNNNLAIYRVYLGAENMCS